jgi:pimeloyl-ACP methyl ester carboxylesterase
MPPLPDPAVRFERMAVVAPDGTRLSVLLAEPPDPTPGLPRILAVHGFGSSAEYTWGTTGHLTALARTGRTVIAPDLRGHGLSDRPHQPDRYRFDALLADLAATIAATGGPGLDVLGYSLGARLSWSLAADAGLRVRRLVLGGYDGRLLFEGVDARRLSALVGDLGAADAPAAHGREAARTAADPTRRIAGIVHAVRGNDREALTALVTGLPGTVTHDPEPQIPTLVAAGTADPLASGAELLAAGLPDGEYLPIPGRDHVSAVPSGVFRRAVVEFLGRA